jgi:hypothetical protein
MELEAYFRQSCTPCSFLSVIVRQSRSVSFFEPGVRHHVRQENKMQIRNQSSLSLGVVWRLHDPWSSLHFDTEKRLPLHCSSGNQINCQKVRIKERNNDPARPDKVEVFALGSGVFCEATGSCDTLLPSDSLTTFYADDNAVRD